MNRLAGDHAEEQGEERGQPGLGGRPVGQADGAQTDNRKEMLVSGQKLRAQRGLRGLEALETQTGTELGPASHRRPQEADSHYRPRWVGPELSP